MGNLHSVAKALEHVGALGGVVTHDAANHRGADRVVFPGVGAIRDCMAELKASGLTEVRSAALREAGAGHLRRHAGADGPFSEENGGVDCLGMFAGR
jgi:glutamine amidotransferase